MDQQLPNEGLLRVDVRGNEPALWQRLREKLLQAIDGALDTIVDPTKRSTFRDEAKKFTSALIDHCEAKLRKAGLDNERIEAEVHKLYAEAESMFAEARKRNAEADAIEFDTAVRRLRLAVSISKAMLVGADGDEALLFTQQIDAFLEYLGPTPESAGDQASVVRGTPLPALGRDTSGS